MCKFFGVSRSGCYAFVHRLGRPEQDAALAEVIAKQRERSFRMNRDFHASKPNSKWVTDISYIHTRQGVLYLSMIRDLYDNSIVACKTGTEQTVNLVLDTIRLAMKQEKRKKPECCCIRAFYGGASATNDEHPSQLVRSPSSPSSISSSRMSSIVIGVSLPFKTKVNRSSYKYTARRKILMIPRLTFSSFLSPCLSE